MYRHGDLIFGTGQKIFHKLIAFFTRTSGEPQTIAKHVGGFSTENNITEALWTVKTFTKSKWLNKHKNFEIWRNNKWTNEECELIGKELLKYEKNNYGWWKLLFHATDLVVSRVIGEEIYVFRRMLFNDETPICSWIYAFSVYNVTGYTFGDYPPNVVDPDTMRDIVIQNDEWELVTKCVNGVYL